jgi:hypothetical protein
MPSAITGPVFVTAGQGIVNGVICCRRSSCHERIAEAVDADSESGLSSSLVATQIRAKYQALPAARELRNEPGK